jgi:eukaryotic-like serine/threonine-protein kinase
MTAASSFPPPHLPLPCDGGLPRTFGSYTLFELIGRGGMAQIYLARAETELGATRLMVVKQILPAFDRDPRFADMLIHEAKLAARLNHKHIVNVLDLGRAEGHLFIAMEYVEGFDLNALLRRCTQQKVGLPAPHALGIVLDVLTGLDYAHRRTGEDGKPLGIVHRDVSPSNVLVSFEGEVKLCDFGIAHANELVNEDASEALKGKAGYMSPEHARGEAIDARADVFAAGIILWELLAGRRLYSTKSELSLLDQAKRAEVPVLPVLDLPRYDELEVIVRRALVCDREQRYPSAAAFARDLEAYVAASGLLASRLKLGEWIATTFGTAIVDDRRASERRLPKSVPPPRSSERLRAAASSENVLVPKTPRVPHELAPSHGAMRAFQRELDDSAARITMDPGSLEGAAMEVPASSRAPLEAPPSSSNVALASKRRQTMILGVILACLVVLAAMGLALVR